MERDLFEQLDERNRYYWRAAAEKGDQCVINVPTAWVIDLCEHTRRLETCLELLREVRPKVKAKGLGERIDKELDRRVFI